MSTKYCRHIKTNGERCASVALRSGAFCYFHTESEKRHKRMLSRSTSVQTIIHPMSLQDGSQRDPIPAAPEPLPFDLPNLEDRHSVQLALSLLLNAVARNQLDPRRAALLLYGLQIASTNARNLNPEPQRRPAKVTLTTLDEATGELIAPDADPEDPDDSADYERKSFIHRYMEKIEREAPERERRRNEEQAAREAEKLAAQQRANPQPFIPPPPL
jgi:hypothetical protein